MRPVGRVPLRRYSSDSPGDAKGIILVSIRSYNIVPMRSGRSVQSIVLCRCLLALLVGWTIVAQSQSLEGLRQGFRHPPGNARPMMRWWWFGPAVTNAELQKELRTMRRAGIGGVEIQPVYPLVLDDEKRGSVNLKYLSAGFLEAITFANTTARSLGMRVDITLGSGWPYGGPKTSLDLSAMRLKVIQVPVIAGVVGRPGLSNGDTFLAAFLIPGTTEGIPVASARQIDPGLTGVPGLKCASG